MSVHLTASELDGISHFPSFQTAAFLLLFSTVNILLLVLLLC